MGVRAAATPGNLAFDTTGALVCKPPACPEVGLISLVADSTVASCHSPTTQRGLGDATAGGQDLLVASPLVTRRAVDLLPEDVGVPGVPGVLPDDVHVDPAQ